jgi:hypothetical protein
MSDWESANLEEAARERGAVRCPSCRWLVEDGVHHPTCRELLTPGERLATLERELKFLGRRLEMLLAEHGQTL